MTTLNTLPLASRCLKKLWNIFSSAYIKEPIVVGFHPETALFRHGGVNLQAYL
jgi:hypothetical protein